MCALEKEREREEGHTRQRNSPVAKGKERRKGRKDAKPKRRANDSSFIHTHRSCCRGEEKERRGERRDSRGEVRKGGRFRVRWNGVKRLCNPSQLHYLATPCVPFSTLCHATVVYVLSRRNFSHVCRPLEIPSSIWSIRGVHEMYNSWNLYRYEEFNLYRIFRNLELYRKSIWLILFFFSF